MSTRLKRAEAELDAAVADGQAAAQAAAHRIRDARAEVLAARISADACLPSVTVFLLEGDRPARNLGNRCIVARTKTTMTVRRPGDVQSTVRYLRPKSESATELQKPQQWHETPKGRPSCRRYIEVDHETDEPVCAANARRPPIDFANIK